MSRSKRRKPSTLEQVPAQKPWIKFRTGLMVIGILSLVFGVFMAYQVWPASGLGEVLLWGVGGAIAVWLAFGISLLINIITRGTDFLRSDH